MIRKIEGQTGAGDENRTRVLSLGSRESIGVLRHETPDVYHYITRGFSLILDTGVTRAISRTPFLGGLLNVERIRFQE